MTCLLLSLRSRTIVLRGRLGVHAVGSRELVMTRRVVGVCVLGVNGSHLWTIWPDRLRLGKVMISRDHASNRAENLRAGLDGEGKHRLEEGSSDPRIACARSDGLAGCAGKSRSRPGTWEEREGEQEQMVWEKNETGL